MSTKNIPEAVPTNNETSVKPASTEKIKAPRQKLRSVAELDTVAPTTMTREEAMKYIKFIREENLKLQSKVSALEDNIKSAFAKTEYVARAAESVEKVYAEQLEFMMSSLKNLKTSCECAASVTVAHVNNLKKGIQ